MYSYNGNGLFHVGVLDPEYAPSEYATSLHIYVNDNSINGLEARITKDGTISIKAGTTSIPENTYAYLEGCWTYE